MRPTQLPNKETTPTLMEGFEARMKSALRHNPVSSPKPKGQVERLIRGEPYACINVKLGNRRITAQANVLPKRVEPLMFRVTTIQEDRARLFGTEVFGSLNDYSKDRFLTTKSILPMYVTDETPGLKQKFRLKQKNEIFWRQEPDTQAFPFKW